MVTSPRIRKFVWQPSLIVIIIIIIIHLIVSVPSLKHNKAYVGLYIIHKGYKKDTNKTQQM